MGRRIPSLSCVMDMNRHGEKPVYQVIYSGTLLFRLRFAQSEAAYELCLKTAPFVGNDLDTTSRPAKLYKVFKQLSIPYAILRQAGAGASRVEQVAAMIERELDAGTWRSGQRIPTVRALAEQFGVSSGAAHAAIRHLQSIGRLQARQGSGTYVVDTRTTAVNPAVYLVMFGNQSAFGQVIRTLTPLLQQQDLALMPVVLDPKDDAGIARLVAQWRRQPPRGVIVKGRTPRLINLMDRADLDRTRLVTICMMPDPTPWHNVRPDEEKAYQLAASNLFARGYRRIGLISTSKVPNDGMVGKALGVDRAIEADCAEAKRLSYTRRVNVADLGYDPPPAEDPDLDRLAQWLAGDDGPDAIIEHVERMAVVRLAARRAGRTFGKDLGIVGVGEPAPGQQGEYPCVTENLDEVAQRVVNLIVDDDPDLDRIARHTIVPPTTIDFDLEGSAGA